MSVDPPSKPMICEEVFDDRSQPSEEEVREFAIQIGIDPDVEAHLLPLARNALMKPLPKHWKPVYDHKLGRFYYFNFKTEQSSWEHPLDSKFRELVKKSRSESLSSAGEEDSKTSVREELKSFEETACDSLENHACMKEEEMASPSQWRRPPSAHGFRGTVAASSATRHSSHYPLHQDVRSNLEPASVQFDKTGFVPRILSTPITAVTSSNKLSLKLGKSDKSSLLQEENKTNLNSKNHFEVSDQKKVDLLSNKKKSVSFESPIWFDDESNSTSKVGRFSIDTVPRIDIDKQLKRLDHEQSENVNLSSEKNSKRGPTRSEFTVTGGGSVFLKSKQKTSPLEKSNETLGGDIKTAHIKQSDIDNVLRPLHELMDNTHVDGATLEESLLKTVDREEISNSTAASLSSTRSILRPHHGDKPLWDMEPQTMTSHEKILWKQQELEEEKKSVRFNLDQELNISFKSLDSLDSESEEEMVEEVELYSDEGSSHSTEKQRGSKFSGEGVESSKGLVEENKQTMHTSSSNTPHENFIIKPTQRAMESKAFHVTNPSIMVQKSDINVSSNNDSKGGEKLENKGRLMIALDAAHDWGKAVDPLDAVLPSPSGAASLLRVDSVKSFPPAISESSHSSDVCEGSSHLKIMEDDTGEISKPSGVIQPLSPASSEGKQTDAADIVSQEKANVIKTAISRESILNQGYCETQKDYPSYDRSAENVALPHLKDIETSNDSLFDNGTSVEEKDDLFEKFLSVFENRFKDQIKKLSEDYMKRVQMKEQEFRLELENREKDLAEKYASDLLKQKEFQERKDKELKETVSRLESEYETRVHQLKELHEHKQECALQELKEMHQQALAAQEVENQATLLRIREQHAINMKILREELMKEEEDFRKEHIERILNIEKDRAWKHFKDPNEHRAFEKLQRENHLLENKYRTLKEKYIKLKTELKMNPLKNTGKNNVDQISCEDQKQKADHQPIAVHDSSSSQTQSQFPSDRSCVPKEKATPSTFNSINLGFHSNLATQRQEPQHSFYLPSSTHTKDKKTLGNVSQCESINECHEVSSIAKTPSLPSQDASHSDTPRTSVNFSNDHPLPNEEKSGHSLGAFRFRAPNREPTLLSAQANHSQQINDNRTPMEALRNQLRSLDKLEEQFSAASLSDTFLRYPVSDHGKHELKSEELAFVRHRIHLEQNKLRKAKGSLETKQREYQVRLKDYMQRQSSSAMLPQATLQQMSEEEKELSDLEEELRRTQSLLIEKITHLHNLEKSFQNFSPTVLSTPKDQHKSSDRPSDTKPFFNRRWDWKTVGVSFNPNVNDEISSISSGSSGFSSTEHTSHSKQGSIGSFLGRGEELKTSNFKTTDINASISNLNSEINEVMNALCQRRTQAGLGPPAFLNGLHRSVINNLSFMSNGHNFLRTPIPASSSSIGLTQSQPIPEKSTLIERSNNLRHWLQSVKVDAFSHNHVNH